MSSSPFATRSPMPSQQQQQNHHSRSHRSSHQSSSSSQYPTVVGNHYRVGKKLGEGSFGVIYEGTSLISHSPCAIKFESRKCDAPQLANEYRCYKLLQGVKGIPQVHYFGQDGLHNILCMDLQGQNLESMFDLCGRKFSIKTVCMVAKRMITLIQSVHEHNMIYRDIKPDNFLIGRPPRNTELQYALDFLTNHSVQNPHPTSNVYLVDFGMAKQYRDPNTKVHIPYREKKSLSGTARYMSINTHLGREQSRRDDLESLGHVFMYFLRGHLPWQGLKAATNKQKYEKIGEKKQTTSVKELADGFPEEFGQYLLYARNLQFEETPDYDFLRRLFDKILYKHGLFDDGVFDWMIEMERQLREREQRRRNRENQNRVNSADESKPDVFGKDGSLLKPATSNITLGTSLNGGISPRISMSRGNMEPPVAAATRKQLLSKQHPPPKHPNHQSALRASREDKNLPHGPLANAPRMQHSNSAVTVPNNNAVYNPVTIETNKPRKKKQSKWKKLFYCFGGKDDE